MGLTLHVMVAIPGPHGVVTFFNVVVLHAAVLRAFWLGVVVALGGVRVLGLLQPAWMTAAAPWRGVSRDVPSEPGGF